MSQLSLQKESTRAAAPKWGAVNALSLGVFGLIVAEFLPASLLTPMAQSLSISEGLAGQAVTATAAIALISGLFITAVTRNRDRRFVLLFFMLLQVVSSLIVALAPSATLMIIGRLLLGIAIGGFWAMSTAVAMRLVPAEKVPKALAIIFAGVSVGTVVTAPLGSYLGGVIGWRSVYILGAIPCLIAFIWQLKVLPSMKPEKPSSLRTLINVLSRPGITPGKLAIILIWGGHFAFFTYLRPFLETVSGFSIEGVSLVLLAFGIANILGNSAAGFFLSRKLRPSLAIPPLLMGGAGLLLVAVGHNAFIAVVLVVLWGFSFAIMSVGWPTWLSVTVPDETESAGGLFIAAMQLAIGTGAAAGGLMFDISGASGVFIGGGVALVCATIVIFTKVKMTSTV